MVQTTDLYLLYILHYMTLTSKIVCSDEANMNYANMTSTVDNTYMLPQRIWGIS
jgi:hypothetical protein